MTVLATAWDRFKATNAQRGVLCTLVIVALNLGYFIGGPVVLRRWWPGIQAVFGDDYRLFTIGEGVLHEGVFFGSVLVYELLYSLSSETVESWKIQTRSWPWLHADPAVRERWRELRARTMRLLAFNHFVLAWPLTFYFYGDAAKGGMRADLDSFPEWYVMAGHLLFFIVVQDFLFYWSHRLLHHPRVYPYIHKMHHEYRTTVGITSEYAHPIEFLFGNVIPFGVGPLLVGAHQATRFMWTVLRILETVDSHSGYAIPFSMFNCQPLGVQAEWHDWHHYNFRDNYGNPTIDLLFGTDSKSMAGHRAVEGDGETE